MVFMAIVRHGGQQHKRFIILIITVYIDEYLEVFCFLFFVFFFNIIRFETYNIQFIISDLSYLAKTALDFFYVFGKIQIQILYSKIKDFIIIELTKINLKTSWSLLNQEYPDMTFLLINTNRYEIYNVYFIISNLYYQAKIILIFFFFFDKII